MSNVFSLDSLREEVEKEFSPVAITVSDGTDITLRNLLRLPKKEREAVLAKLKELNKVGEDHDDDETPEEVDQLIEHATQILMLVADNGRKLIKELGGDLAVIMKVLEVWMETAQPGEAKPSPN